MNTKIVHIKLTKNIW